MFSPFPLSAEAEREFRELAKSGYKIRVLTWEEIDIFRMLCQREELEREGVQEKLF